MKNTVLLFLLAMITLLTAGCAQGNYETEKAQSAVGSGMYKKEPGSSTEGRLPALSYAPDKPLFALAESEEEAKEIAESYGIELVEFNYGVASFYTDKDLRELIEWGKEQGLPLLEINYITQIN